MINFLGIFSILAFFLNLNEKKLPETKMVINVFRHGARTPKHYISEVEKIFKKYPAGSLTDNGWRMQFLLGKYLKRRLPPKFIKKPSDFLLICSYKERAINSGISFASGLVNEMFQMINFDKLIGKQNSCGVCRQLSLSETINTEMRKKQLSYRERFKYPPIKNFAENENLNKYLLMIVSQKQDVLFHGRSCKFKKKYNYKLGKSNSKEFFSDISFDEHKLIFNYLKREFKQTLSNINDFKEITHLDIKNFYLIIRSLESEKPGLINKMDAETESAFYKVIFDYYYNKAISSDDHAKVTSSMFFDHLIYFFDSKTNNSQPYHSYKVVSYSGHDYNILGLINNLYGRKLIFSLNKSQHKDFLFSSYSSSFEFHLIKNDVDEYYVRIYYNGREPYFPFNHYIDEKGNSVLPVYYEGLGVQYTVFKKWLSSITFSNYQKCYIKTKSNHNLLMKVLKIRELFNIKSSTTSNNGFIVDVGYEQFDY